MTGKLVFPVAGVVLGAFVATGPAIAAGGEDETTDVPECSDGMVWDASTEKCVEQSSRTLETDEIYLTGSSLAKAGRYGEAITILSIAANRGDPRILNYLGYSHRMQGRVKVGLGYYQEALRVDPDFTLAREYMGEAYLQLGDVAAAKKQLEQIEARCGQGCEEYAELSARIAAYEQDA